MSTRIRDAIEQHGHSINSFSRLIGVSQSTVHRIANGEVDIDKVQVGVFIRVAQGLGMSVEQLYYGDDIMHTSKREMNRIYDELCPEARRSLLACARGLALTYGTKLALIDDDYFSTGSSYSQTAFPDWT